MEWPSPPGERGESTRMASSRPGSPHHSWTTCGEAVPPLLQESQHMVLPMIPAADVENWHVHHHNLCFSWTTNYSTQELGSEYKNCRTSFLASMETRPYDPGPAARRLLPAWSQHGRMACNLAVDCRLEMHFQLLENPRMVTFSFPNTLIFNTLKQFMI